MWSCAATSWANAAQLELVGSARLQVLFWPVYDSRLYATGCIQTKGRAAGQAQGVNLRH